MSEESKKLVNQPVTIDVKFIIDGMNIVVETPWATSVMPTEKAVNMVLAYGSLHWKEPQIPESTSEN